jgi:SAM-dependent methyltransferase
VSRGPEISSPRDLHAIRASRRHPTITQYNYLHLRRLVDGLATVLADVPGPVQDVLDVWCGSRPYEDLLPAGARCVGLDVSDNPYGVADVVSDEFLPFEDASFDLVTCVQALQYMPDPAHAVSEFARVLRPGATAVVSLVFGDSYDRRSFEGRYTSHQLRQLFAGWDDVQVREDGGRTVTWTMLTASLLFGLEQRAGRRPIRRALRPLFVAAYAAVNGVGLALAPLDSDTERAAALPMNLTLTARTPAS